MVEQELELVGAGAERVDDTVAIEVEEADVAIGEEVGSGRLVVVDELLRAPPSLEADREVAAVIEHQEVGAPIAVQVRDLDSRVGEVHTGRDLSHRPRSVEPPPAEIFPELRDAVQVDDVR
jgi:hypothetical protein